MQHSNDSIHQHQYGITNFPILFIKKFKAYFSSCKHVQMFEIIHAYYLRRIVWKFFSHNYSYLIVPPFKYRLLFTSENDIPFRIIFCSINFVNNDSFYARINSFLIFIHHCFNNFLILIFQPYRSDIVSHIILFFQISIKMIIHLVCQFIIIFLKLFSKVQDCDSCQQIIMLNYKKLRDSVNKNSSNKSIRSGITANKSHKSSVSIKLMQQGQQQTPVKRKVNQRSDLYLQLLTKQSSSYIAKKNSIKAINNDKQNTIMSKNDKGRKSQSPLQQSYRHNKESRHNLTQTVRPAQFGKVLKESNRNLDYSASKIKNLKYRESTQNKLKTEYQQPSYDKNSRQTALRPSTIKIPIKDIQNLVEQVQRQHRQLIELNRQLEFYRSHAAQETNNPVFLALKK